MDAATDSEALRSWVMAARQGELGAFNALVRLHQRQVYNLCYRMLHHSEEAADATQECFLAAYRGIHSLQGPPEAFRAWLLRIAARGCYDQLRRKRRRPAESLDAAGPDGEPADVPSKEAGPEERAARSETAARIQAGLNELSPDHRLVVVLCDVQGMSYEEAAGLLEVELGTIKSRLSRARAQLRTYLVQHGELPSGRQRL